MPTGVECVHHSMELTPQLTLKGLNANTAFTADCVHDLLVVSVKLVLFTSLEHIHGSQWVNGVCCLYGYSPMYVSLLC